MQSDQLHVVIVSPERKLYDAEVDSLFVPGEKGRFEVLTHHAALLSTLTAGEVVCVGAQPLTLSVSSGFIEVKDNLVTLCVEVS